MSGDEFKRLEEIAEEICDQYCKYPGEYHDPDNMIATVCEKCPLNDLIEDYRERG